MESLPEDFGDDAVFVQNHGVGVGARPPRRICRVMAIEEEVATSFMERTAFLVEGYLILMEAAFSECFKALRNKENTQRLNTTLKKQRKTSAIRHSRNCRRPIRLGRR